MKATPCALNRMRRSLSYAKIVQAERNRACSELLRRSLSYAKIVQAERNRACSELLRRSLSYAKVEKIIETYSKSPTDI